MGTALGRLQEDETATAYIAARWAVRGFTEALRADLTGTGIGVTLFESGVVHSPVRGIQREQKLVVVPFMMKLTYWQHALFPGIVQWLMTRTGYKRLRV